jgi:hypothetical protein
MSVLRPVLPLPARGIERMKAGCALLRRSAAAPIMERQTGGNEPAR